MMRSTQSMRLRDCMPTRVSWRISAGWPITFEKSRATLKYRPYSSSSSLRVPLQRQAVAGDERLVQQPRHHASGLVRVVDALAVERVGRSGRVADDRPRRADLRVDRARPSGCVRRSARTTGLSGSISQYAGAVAAHSAMRCDVLTLRKSRNVDSRPMPTLIVPSPTGKIQP